MERFKKEPISTILGLILFISGFVFLFVPTLYEIPLYGLAILVFGGILLCFAKDKFLDIITLGLSRFVSDVQKKVVSSGNSIPGGGVKEPDDEEEGEGN